MRLIDIDAMSNEMYHLAFETDSDMQKWDGGCWIRYKLFEICRDNASTIEAEPVRHGYWIERYGVHEGKYYKCSACNYNCSHTKENYCSYCGAKMDGERRHDAEKL